MSYSVATLPKLAIFAIHDHYLHWHPLDICYLAILVNHTHMMDATSHNAIVDHFFTILALASGNHKCT